MEHSNEHSQDRDSGLELEKAVTLAAIAAATWCERDSGSPRSGSDRVSALMDAAAYVTRARRGLGLPAISVAALVDGLSQRIDGWLPGAGAFPLVENGEPSVMCAEIVDAAGTSALEEVEQGVIKQAMSNVSSRPDAADRYTTFRQFLVENAHASRLRAAEAVRAVGLELASLYGPIRDSARVLTGSEARFFPCPRCRWPLTNRDGDLTCARSRSCLAAGARFRLEDSNLLPLGALSPPTALSCAGQCALHAGVWRYTVLPGLEELALAEQICGIDGARVTLWPYVDAYDLDVHKGDVHWRVDVKDHASTVMLARHLSERPVRESMWIVVPDARRDQVAILRRSVRADAGYLFASASQFVRRLREAG